MRRIAPTGWRLRACLYGLALLSLLALESVFLGMLIWTELHDSSLGWINAAILLSIAVTTWGFGTHLWHKIIHCLRLARESQLPRHSNWHRYPTHS